jgi:hypothetical protein
MKTVFSLLLVSVFVALPAFGEGDPYNSFRWKSGDTRDWYEWWYYKVVDPETGEAFYFTYGVVNPGDSAYAKAGTKAVLQMGSFGSGVVLEQDFPLNEFSASAKSTEIHVGANVATDKRITGSMTGKDGNPVSWDLAIEKDWGFEAMGWVIRVPELSNIYWYPAQASARMTGTVEFGGKKYAFQNATAYQDRNWGRSFPLWWTWLVSNNFKSSPGTVLVAGGGKPRAFNGPALLSGLCIGLKHEGREYAFRTTDGDKVKFEIRWGKWEVTAYNRRGQKIEISAYAPPEKFLLLPFETPKGETFYDYEALTGQMTVKLFRKVKGKWVPEASLETDQAGIEWGAPEPLGLQKAFSSALKLQ